MTHSIWILHSIKHGLFYRAPFERKFYIAEPHKSFDDVSQFEPHAIAKTIED